MKKIVIFCLFLAFSLSTPAAFAQDNTKGIAATVRMFADNGNIYHQTILYSTKLYKLSDEENGGIFGYFRVADAPNSPIIALVGFSYSPTPWLIGRLGGGLEKQAESNFRGNASLWIGTNRAVQRAKWSFQIMSDFGNSKDDIYFEMTARHVFPSSPWFALGGYAQKKMGYGPFVEIMPTTLPLQVGFAPLVKEWKGGMNAEEWKTKTDKAILLWLKAVF